MRRGGSSVLRLYAKVLHHRLVLVARCFEEAS